ncbi:MAG: hypothetical protein JW941_12075, partial [Candidatus Coatesbacteria bacterium]|nr:hypothetical protein [Candidatus Coatesbacteria bacterium]
MRSLTTTILLLSAFTLCATCFAQDYTIESHRCKNFITGLDYRDGTLAIGTRLGLQIFRDGELRTLTVGDGLPTNYIPDVALADADSVYIGPCTAIDGRADLVYLVHFPETGVSVEEITKGLYLSGSHFVFNSGPDGSLWIGEGCDMVQYSQGQWSWFYGQGAVTDYWDICFGKAGEVFVCSSGVVYEISGNQIVPLPSSFWASQVVMSPEGDLLTTGDGYLWRYGPAGWEVASSDSFLGEHPSGIFFDGLGHIWGTQSEYEGLGLAEKIARYRDGEVDYFEAADDFVFSGSTLEPWSIFISNALIPPEIPVFGLDGLGLVYFDGESFHRFYNENCPPGDIISDICEDSQGRLWVINGNTRMLGVYDGERWKQVHAPWYLPWDVPGVWKIAPLMALDIDGSLWFRSETGAVSYRDSEWSYYDQSNSPLVSPGDVAVDGDGNKWFVNPEMGMADWEPICDAARFDGDEWKQYDSDDYFESWWLVSVSMGPRNTVWFTRRSPTDYISNRFTTYDGSVWRHLTPGIDQPNGHAERVYFDLEGNALIACHDSLYRQNETDSWEPILDMWIDDAQADSSGTLYCARPYDDALYVGEKGSWQKITMKWDMTDPNSDLTTPPQRVFIDHNGDKWIGCYGGLYRLQDGGPAAQKLNLQTISGHSQGGEGETLIISGEFINTATTMPVSLRLAV